MLNRITSRLHDLLPQRKPHPNPVLPKPKRQHKNLRRPTHPKHPNNLLTGGQLPPRPYKMDTEGEGYTQA